MLFWCFLALVLCAFLMLFLCFSGAFWLWCSGAFWCFSGAFWCFSDAFWPCCSGAFWCFSGAFLVLSGAFLVLFGAFLMRFFSLLRQVAPFSARGTTGCPSNLRRSAKESQADSAWPSAKELWAKGKKKLLLQKTIQRHGIRKFHPKPKNVFVKQQTVKHNTSAN